MKIRNNFVSNSSSTFFVIAYKNDDSYIINLFNNYDGKNEDEDENIILRESGISVIGADCILELLKEGQEAGKRLWARIEDKKDDESLGYGGRTIKDKRQYLKNCHNEKDKLIKEIKKYNKEGWKIADIFIGYHDDRLNMIFNQMVKNGNIVILKSEGEKK